MTTLCSEFRRLSAWTWRRMTSARALDMPFNEETITESLLLKLKKRAGSRLVIKAFSKHAEKKHGADWEFVFLGASSPGLAIRVQAKRLDYKQNKYQNLHKPRSRQWAKLIHNSGKKIPFYLFYNHDGFVHPSKAKWQDEDWGCSIVPVKLVPFKLKQPTPDLIPEMIPWHKLFCSPQGTHQNIDELVRENIRKSFPEFARDERLQLEGPRQIADFEFWKLLKSMRGEQDYSSEVENHLARNKLDGLAVFWFKEE